MTLRLASWNVRKAVGLDWKRRPERVLDVLGEVGADVVALQEADKRLGPRPAAIPPALLALHGRWRHLDPGPGPSLGWHGNAILLGPGAEAEVADRLALPGLEPRGALLARVRAKGAEFLLVAAHLGLNRGSRHRQVAAILAAAARVPLPLVVAGDLNERAPGRLLVGLHPALAAVSPGPTFHASRPVLALDHLLLGPGVRATASAVHASPLARVASDHLPIWAELAF